MGRIRIRKQQEQGLLNFYHMWCGRCTCGKTWQYWNFGATLGYGLYHLRSCNNDNLRRG